MNLLVWTQAMEDGISGDHVDPLSNLSLKENEELLAINDIGGLLELLDELTSLKALLNKSVHAFDVVVSPKRTKSFNWTVNIDDATLEGLKRQWGEIFTSERSRPLQLFVTNKSFNFTVPIETPSKPFSDWSFPKVCELYGISNVPNPDIDVFPVFTCGSTDLNSDKSKTMVEHLMAEIKLRQDVTPLNKENEETKVEMGIIEVTKEDFMKGFA
ncbi:hypothetical protein GLOIN_2v1768338 [Rhizophagus irregularis DAOM 181602=DAOM 197198]|uniref:Crinkler family protein n=1 Tax=Rhizophagus irregularis (strain DAOM 181602 / DAOM 197198 / MUCL 43194) TaxID=747089 RepID=A0A2P4QHJ5_RHIID|nr:hypothetical protein GLOIN_2v1768338 [Rhizophagus irregularis DAOM 181602=DAOM 197198]POG77080.1 hypothetical protein GLOIN_2v1768338 [Rhizophagus irregularis DAOM 181602=DAOM 197198]|eukprot:XP_025183946.1 hypothetical protein GLOIN_2v1768338 [Rhizophagus irregularis DAOM 181602=DAOM 197198]